VTNIGEGLLNRGDVVGALNQQIEDADDALAIAKKEKARLTETRKKISKLGKDTKDKYPEL
jgi:hypothetical protein